MITLKYYDLDGREVRPEDWADTLVMGTVKTVIDQYQQPVVVTNSHKKGLK